jgi:alkylation response protein AidB-like acyl-CoA dehydrogenase
MGRLRPPRHDPDGRVRVHDRWATVAAVDFALEPEDEAFRDELRAWLDEHLPPFLEKEELDDGARLSGTASQRRRAAWQRELHTGRWAAIHWPVEYGGRAATPMQRVISSEVMAEYRTPGMFNTNGIWQIGPMIITWGTDEQKARWLPSILEAHEHWCQGFSEPDAGNDLANLRTTAILDGDHYVVNGQKIWISTAHLAKWGLFLLRTDPTAIERGAKHEGITAFIIDLETPGIECRPIRDMAGEEMFNEVYFEDARIPVDCRLGGEGEGWMVAMGTLGFERVGIAGQLSILGADLRAMVEAARSVNPDALDDPGIQERLAETWTEIELAKLLSLRALSRIIKGERPWPEVQFAKLQWSSLAQTMAELAVDMLGPAGVLAKGGPDTVDRGKWTRLYSFQRYSTIGGGSSEVQKNIIADRAIKLPGQARTS